MLRNGTNMERLEQFLRYSCPRICVLRRVNSSGRGPVWHPEVSLVFRGHVPPFRKVYPGIFLVEVQKQNGARAGSELPILFVLENVRTLRGWKCKC